MALNLNDLNSEAEMQKTINDLFSNNTKLDSIFENLGPALISSELQMRIKAMKFIALLIQNLPQNHLNQIEVNHLSTFLCSKYEDHFSICPLVLSSIENLIKYNNEYLSDENKLNILKCTLRDIHIQSLLQSDRFIVYSICEYYLCHFVSIIKLYKYDNDFIYGYLQAMDAEKDPRNLVICFRNIANICKKLNVDNFVEDIFEAFSCYFPIDFNPSSNENSVSRVGLIELLRNCFSSTGLFARFTMPLLLEKIDSDVDSAKLDSILTYIECSNTYDVGDYKEYIEPLWTSFQRIVMSTSSSALEDGGLKAIQSLTFSIAKTAQKEDTLLSLDQYINKCIESSLVYLNDVDLKLIWPSVKCLQSISNSTSTSHLIVLKTTLPFLLGKINSSNPTQINQKRIYGDILWKFISISLKYSPNAPTCISSHTENLVNICMDFFNTKQLLLQSLFGFNTLMRFDNLLTCNDQLIEIFVKLVQNLNNYSDFPDHYRLIVKTILLIEVKNEFCSNKVFQYFQAELVKSETQLHHMNELLIESIKSENNLKLEDLLRINNRIYEIVFKYLNDNVERLDVQKLKSCFDINVNLVKNKNVEKKLFTNLFDFIFDKLLLNAGNIDVVVHNTSNLLNAYSVNLSSFDDYQFVLSRLDENYKYIFLEDNSKGYSYQILNLYMQFICSLDIKIFETQLDQFFVENNRLLYKLAMSGDVDEATSLCAAQFYASLINKNSDKDSFIAKHLNEVFINDLINSIENNTGNTSNRFLQLWLWITKALVLREHKLAEKFLIKIVNWLDYSALSDHCSDGFFLILNENDHVLNKCRTNANVRMFYRQKYFINVINKINDKFNSNSAQSTDYRIPYVKSLLNILNFLPKQLIGQQLPSMLPMLVFSLGITTNESLCVCSLKLISELLKQSKTLSSSLRSYIDEILAHLYQLFQYKFKMEIRLLSIECISTLSSLSPQIVMKHQACVIKKLEHCLNDPKRLVRQKAVLARNKWCLLSTKNEN